MPGYSTYATPLKNGNVLRIRLLHDDVKLRWSEVVRGWQDDFKFRQFFIALLKDAPFPAYFWETPPVTDDSMRRNFEFILSDSPQLAGIHTDEQAFRNRFSSLPADTAVTEFVNLGGDARLVVPCPGNPLSAYSHLAAFTRSAPGDQQHQLWIAVGAALERMINRQPVWLSTSGLGVSWIHVRLDSYPKYYTYEPYLKLGYS